MVRKLTNRRQLIGSVAATAASTILAPVLLRAVEPKVIDQPYNTLTVEQEIAVGRTFSVEYEKEVQILDHSMIDAYLSRIVRALGDASQRPQWPYQIKVVNSASINACAMPGGFLYVQRGLLEMVSEESEMVGALAHEVGHVVARHTTNQLVLLLLAQNLFELVKKTILLDSDIFGQIIQTLGGPLVLLAQLKYSRDNEPEADMLGFYEMMRAGWNPDGMLKLFTHLEQNEGPANILDGVLSDHPATAERTAAIRRELVSVNIPQSLNEQNSEFSAMKLALSQMPPAPKSAGEGNSNGSL